MTAVLRRFPVASYVALALAISWLFEVPIALKLLPGTFHYLAAFGPACAALLVTAATGGRPALSDLGRRITRWRLSSRWLLVAVGSPVLLFGAAASAARLVNGAWPAWSRLGEVNFLGDIGAPAALVLWIGTFGFGEEIGWRGFALPRLQQRYSALTATVVVAGVWAVWHLPSFFYLPTYVELGLAGLPGFALGLLLGAILLTWIYNSTGGSIFAVALWHALYDFLSASQATDLLMNGVMATVIMLAALAVLLATHLRLSAPPAHPHGLAATTRAGVVIVH